MTQLSIVFERILDSIQKVLRNLFGWIIALFSAYLAWLGNDSGSFLLVLIAILWDMAWDTRSDLEYLQSRVGKQVTVDTHMEGIIDCQE